MATKKTTKKDTQTTEVLVPVINRHSLKFHILGTSPLLYNAMKTEDIRSLIFPRVKGKNTGLKHNPVEEFRASVYKMPNDDAPTLLSALGVWFKLALAQVAVDIETPLSKARLKRVVKVEAERVPVWGSPFLSMMMVRMANVQRTPDVRTRAIVPEWATEVEVSYSRIGGVNQQAIVNLLAAGGMVNGIGDGRSERGALSFGSFRLIDPTTKDDPATKKYWEIREKYGREHQIAMMENAVPYDELTADTLEWFNAELVRRERDSDTKPKASAKTKKKETVA